MLLHENAAAPKTVPQGLLHRNDSGRLRGVGFGRWRDAPVRFRSTAVIDPKWGEREVLLSVNAVASRWFMDVVLVLGVYGAPAAGDKRGRARSASADQAKRQCARSVAWVVRSSHRA